MQIINNFIKNFKTNHILIILILLINISFSSTKSQKRNTNVSDEKKLSHNQIKAYPNTYEPITSRKDLNRNKIQIPKLSDAFSEINPKHLIKRELFF